MSGDKTNILFLVPSLRRGGAETQLVDLVSGLDDQYFNKTVIAFEPGLDLQDRLEQSDATFYHYLRTRKIDIALAGKIAGVIDERQIDVVHCTLEISLLMGWLARRYSVRKPDLVAAIHTTLHRTLKDAVLDRLVYRYLMYDCVRVIFVCRTQADHWIRIHRRLSDKAVIVYNGVDHQLFHSELGQGKKFREANNIAPDVKVITCIAGFRVEKGHGYLIDAFARLNGDACLILAGDGVQRQEIEERIAKSGVAERIILLGEVADVKPLITASDVTVIASTAVETFSIAMLESMSMGVPVVATDIGGLGEAVKTGRTGELVAPGCSVALQEALSRVIENVEYRRSLGKQARRDVIEFFSKNAMIRRTEQVLSEIAQI